MMKTTLFNALLSLTISLALALTMAFEAQADNASDSLIALPEYSKVYDDSRDPFEDASAALALAQKTHRQVLIEIGGNWCTWCHKMDAFLEKNPDIYQALHNNYVVLKINVSEANDNADFMSSLPPVLGYPHMYVSTATGKMLLSKDTAELLTNGSYSREQWLSFIHQWSNTLAPKSQKTSNKLRI